MCRWCWDPAVNIKRDPRCGRNFEYYSEDPHLAGVLGAAWVNGIQAEGVGASVKHFAVNNQEHDRMRVSADVDARALREIYLRPFQRVSPQARPWTVMAAYNRINGEWAGAEPLAADPRAARRVGFRRCRGQRLGRGGRQGGFGGRGPGSADARR